MTKPFTVSVRRSADLHTDPGFPSLWGLVEANMDIVAHYRAKAGTPGSAYWQIYEMLTDQTYSFAEDLAWAQCMLFQSLREQRPDDARIYRILSHQLWAVLERELWDDVKPGDICEYYRRKAASLGGVYQEIYEVLIDETYTYSENLEWSDHMAHQVIHDNPDDAHVFEGLSARLCSLLGLEV